MDQDLTTTYGYELVITCGYHGDSSREDVRLPVSLEDGVTMCQLYRDTLALKSITPLELIQTLQTHAERGSFSRRWVLPPNLDSGYVHNVHLEDVQITRRQIL